MGYRQDVCSTPNILDPDNLVSKYNYYIINIYYNMGVPSGME
jgi:hypothetical protein